MRNIASIKADLVAAAGGDDESLIAALRQELAEAKAAPPVAVAPKPPQQAQDAPVSADVELEADIADALWGAKNWPNVSIERIGNWLWLTGDTRPSKDDLKVEGWRWHSKKTKERTDGKGVYYWMPPEVRGRKRRHSNKDLDEIRSKYGSAVLK